MAYYVVGGEYADTTFTEFVRPEAPLGPFESYADAFRVWQGRAMATIDQAYARFEIIEADRPPRIPVAAERLSA